MKHCPKCNRTYADDNQRFCLDDGTLLIARSPTPNYGAPTVLMTQKPTVPHPQPPVATFDRKPVKLRRQLWPMVVGLAALLLSILIVSGWWFSARAGDELLYQTKNDNPVRMRVLLFLGADVNARDAVGSTPLSGAAWRGQTDAVKILLSHGADANARNRSNETPLILAAKEGHTEILRLLLDKNPDVNARDSDGWTCLMWASWGGHADTVKLLLSTGIRAGSQNNRGETAQTLAYKQQHYDIASWIAKETSLR